MNAIIWFKLGDTIETGLRTNAGDKSVVDHGRE